MVIKGNLSHEVYWLQDVDDFTSENTAGVRLLDFRFPSALIRETEQPSENQ